MNKAGGFITLHRQILDWEWFKDTNTLVLFIYLLLTANYVEGSFKGLKVKRGQTVTSIPSLSTGTGLSFQQTRTALKHLVSTGEITDDSCHQYRVITIVKYDDYQKLTDKLTDDQQTTNRRSNRRSTDELTNDQQQYNNNNKENNVKNETMKQERETAARFVPPTKEEIFDFCLENGLNVDVDYLYDNYSSKGWKIGASPMKDWKAAVRNWARRDQKQQTVPAKPSYQKTVPAQQFTQRSYENEQDEAMQRMIDEMRKAGYA